MERPRLVLIATVAAGIVTPSEPVILPTGFDVASAQAVSVFGNYDGGTVTSRLQGSNDDVNPVNWDDLMNATGSAIGADGSDMIGSGAPSPTQALLVGLFKWTRLNLEVTGGGAMAGQVATSMVSAGSVGSGQADT